MKKIFRMIVIVAGMNLLLVWAAYGLLVASGFELFTFWSFLLLGLLFIFFGISPGPTATGGAAGPIKFTTTICNRNES